MRKSILLPLLLAACGGSDAGKTYTEIPDFLANATPITCEAADLGQVAVDILRGATDTSFLVVDAAQHRITEFGDDLHPFWTLEYDEHGPAAVDKPVSAAILGDTAVAILSRGGLRLVILDHSGDLVDARALGFMPGDVANAGDAVYLTAVPMGPTPGTLLFRLRESGIDTLEVPPRPYADMIVSALGNQTLVAGFPDGRALVVHQFLAPRGFLVAGDGTAITPLRVPTPDATAEHIGYIPRPPMTPDQFPDVLVPALAMSVDPTHGRVYLLTRSGHESGGRFERALIRTDDRLGFQAAYTLDAHAVQMAVLPRRQAAVVVDDLDRFFLCPLEAHVITE